jgi:hypothetical protein
MKQAFGIIDTDDEGSFTLETFGPQDILIEKDSTGRIIKKIYIEKCDYRVAKIKYFNENRSISAVLELDDYETIDEKKVLPHKLKIVNYGDEGKPDIINITLKSIKPQDKIKKAIFKKPPTKRYKNIYQLVNGKAIDQSK